MIVAITDISGQEIEREIENDHFIIGRSSDCDIVIVSEHISRKHLEVKIDDGKIMIKDSSDHNWVSYDGKPLSKDVFVQYFNFMDLLLPGDYSITLKSNAPVNVETTLTNIRPISNTKSETNLTRVGKKKSRKDIMKERTKTSSNYVEDKNDGTDEKKKNTIFEKIDRKKMGLIVGTFLIFLCLLVIFNIIKI